MRVFGWHRRQPHLSRGLLFSEHDTDRADLCGGGPAPRAEAGLPIGGCSYPATAKSPIGEDQLWQGIPQAESAPYSTAKMMGVVAAQSFKAQYGLNATVIIPGNLYGEHDNYQPLDSHVVPAMIRRYYEAKLYGLRRVEMWGTGRPERDFVYAGDVARLVPYFIDQFDEVGPINLSSGTTTSIKSLAETIAGSLDTRARFSGTPASRTARW